MSATIHVLAPAKINLFLHITGQRSDGYHTLQTIFQLIDLCDEISITQTVDGQITRLNDVQNIPTEQDLVIKAARLLQRKSQTKLGCVITLKKNIPMGAGLGGGSSDAASVLWGLNELWGTGFSRKELMKFGLELGADVPFFLFGTNAFAEGIGEVLYPINLSKKTVFVIYPKLHIPTEEVFKASNLTRNHPTVTISDFIGSTLQDQFGCNDCEKVVIQKYQVVADAIEWLTQKAPLSSPRMSGAGSSVFTVVDHDLAAQMLKQLPNQWLGYVVQGLQQHPSYNSSS